MPLDPAGLGLVKWQPAREGGVESAKEVKSDFFRGGSGRCSMSNRLSNGRNSVTCFQSLDVCEDSRSCDFENGKQRRGEKQNRKKANRGSVYVGWGSP